MLSTTHSERTLFVGPRIPMEVKLATKHVPGVTKNTFRLLVQLAVNALERRPIPEGALDKIQSQVGPVAHLDELYAGVLSIIRIFLQLPQGLLKLDAFKEDLRELKFPEECITDLASVLYGPKRAALNEFVQFNCPHFPKLENFKWRLDITISSSVLSRVLEPTVLFQIRLNNGNVKIFEVSISKFHELRYSVSSVLKEMEDLEKRSIFKMPS